MADWESLPLRDLLTPVSREVSLVPDNAYDSIGVRWYAAGVFVKPQQLGSAIAAKTLFRVEPADVIYSRLFAWKGSFGVVTAAQAGCVASNEFPTFRASEKLLPEFFAVWSSQPFIWDLAKDMSTGTTENSRNRLSEEDFLDLEISLPSRDEQFRIVRAVRRIDVLIARYRREAHTAERALKALREELISTAQGEFSTVGDLLHGIEAGKSPKAMERPPRDDEWGVLKVSAIRSGEFRPLEAKAVIDPSIFPDRARVVSGDVLISRANTTQLVGAACRVEGEHERLFLCDKTLRLRPKVEIIDPDYLVHALASSGAREQIEEAATGSSESMKNLSQRAILEVEIPVPDDLAAQKAIAGRLEALRSALRGAEAAVSSAQDLRHAVAGALLSGEQLVRDDARGTPDLAAVAS